jgi:hypothetical protein
MIQAAQKHGMGAGRVERDWRAKNVGVMQGGGASQGALLEASAETLASATCTMINTLLATQGCR